ncbi:glucose-1-phosphate thymidylyltransferase [Pedobacter sp. HMF7647]|uniref:Glucose-1-phosphate thymidylyltransferase n=1 Tax=Hufsiella arboris TaxID=2695275 RepID=A0A7K1Y732_9SPHI|nr:GlmU family protein [Hufsiella arboris]MXV50221.1 glucose-1-phosphate thymidylyltransferase [Hufsiella arboris]
MTVILFDDSSRESLFPLTFLRPVAEIRVGILTIADKWRKYLKADVSFRSAEYLQLKFPEKTSDDSNLFINGSICPDENLLEAIDQLADGDVLISGQILLAAKAEGTFDANDFSSYHPITYEQVFTKISFPEDIFRLNDSELRKDFKLLTHSRKSASISSTNTIIGEDIFIEDGFEAECATFNTKNGPIYLGRNSQVWEGTHIRGAFALCNDSQVKMGAKIYGATTIGPFSRVGGEINNSVVFGYSSKGHEGYLGNSVMGEWCNIGADSNNSNLKNNYAEVRLWDYNRQSFRRTGLQFCGLIMADHAKCGINTMFNTGTVVGVGANVFGAGFPRNFIPDFAWGGAQGFEVYTLKKMFETTEKVFERRNKPFDEAEKQLLTNVFELTESYRNFK